MFYNIWAGAKNSNFGSTKLLKIEVELKSHNLIPKHHKPRKLNPGQVNSLKVQINDWHAAGVIKEVKRLFDGNWVCTMVPY